MEPGNEAFAARSAALLGGEGMARLSSAGVAVFGLGGVGGWCAEALARSGVGRLALIDFDRVAPSNLNRQIMAGRSTIGEYKAEALARRLADVAPACSLDVRCQRFCADTAYSFNLATYDFVVDAIDSVDCKALLILRTLAEENTALVSSMGAALRLDPQQVRISKFRKVAGDGLARALRNRFRRSLGELPSRDFDCAWSTEPPLQSLVPGEKGSIVTVTAAFGLAIAAHVIRSLVHGAGGKSGVLCAVGEDLV